MWSKCILARILRKALTKFLIPQDEKTLESVVRRVQETHSFQQLRTFILHHTPQNAGRNTLVTRHGHCSPFWPLVSGSGLSTHAQQRFWYSFYHNSLRPFNTHQCAVLILSSILPLAIVPLFCTCRPHVHRFAITHYLLLFIANSVILLQYSLYSTHCDTLC